MLEIRNITKTFPGVKALDGVSLAFEYGEIHALLGENGAGKSTLIKIITGSYAQDSGEVLKNGEVLRFRRFSDSISKGISLVPQEIQAIPQSSIAENVLLDKIGNYLKCGLIQWDKMYRDTTRYLDMVGLKLPPQTKMAGTSAAQKQLVQIAKAFSSNADILLLDEPTSALTVTEAANLFSILKKLRDSGKAIIFVSHKLEEVLELCDRFSVLRDGKHIGTRSCHGATKQDIIKLMIGRETSNEFYGFLDIGDEKALECVDISQSGRFDKINIHLNKGEILGLYGLVGSGRTELAKIIIGEERFDGGEIRVNGKPASIRCSADALNKYKIGYVSENRKEQGLILNETVRTNILITSWNQISRTFLRLVIKRDEKKIANDMIEKLNIKTTGMEQRVANLSGGNQQKICFARWIAANCDILIIDEPTVGVDVGAKESIHRLIWSFAKVLGKSIILISSDMPELIKLSRRILVFRDYHVAGEINGLNETEHEESEIAAAIGAYIAG